MSKSGDSKDKYDSSGKKYTEHFDNDGNYTGSSRDTTDWFGDKITEHFDKNDSYTGKSENKHDWFGDEYTGHFDKNDGYTGKSEKKHDGWGDEYTGHYNKNDQYTGKSEKKHDWFGDEYTHHTPKSSSGSSNSGSGYSNNGYSGGGSSSPRHSSGGSSGGGYSGGGYSGGDGFGTIGSVAGVAFLIFIVGGLAECFTKSNKSGSAAYTTYSAPATQRASQPEPIKEDLSTIELPSNDEMVADLNNYHQNNNDDDGTVFKVDVTNTDYYSTSIRTFVKIFYKVTRDKPTFYFVDAFIDYDRNNGHWNFRNVLGGLTVDLRRSSLVPDPPGYDRIRDNIEGYRSELWDDEVGELRAVQTSESSIRVNDSLNVMLMPVDVMFINPALQTRLDDKIFVQYRLYGEIWVYDEMFRTNDFDNSYNLGFYE